MSSSTAAATDTQQKLPEGVDLCIPIEDSDLATQGLSSLGNIKYVESLEGCEVLVVGEGYLSKATNIIYEQLANRLACEDGFVVVIDGAKELRSAFIDIMLEALSANGLRMPVMTIERPDVDEQAYSIDPRFYTVDIVAISFKPYGLTFIESKNDVASDIAYVVNNYFDGKQAYTMSYIGAGSGTRMRPAAVVSPHVLDHPNWTYI